MLKFVGKTAIVTGAGGGIGRLYALELAKRGCQVVVNDVGGSVGGESSDTKPADQVVKEIISNGGKAVANYSSVLTAKDIVADTMKHFGSCDIVVNNAGILRDKSFAKMTYEDWQAVLNVHLEGTFRMSHAAWPHMVEKQYGKIINVGSGAGLYGSFGQANYAAAKMGILGLTNVLAGEGAKYNIQANCVVPVALSRMTENILPGSMHSLMKADHIVPFVTYLAHDSCKASGECYEVGGGWYSRIRLQRSVGRSLGGVEKVASAEDIAQNFSSICDFERGTTYPTAAADALQSAMMVQEMEKSGSWLSAEAEKPAAPAAEAAKVPAQPLPSDKLFESINSMLQSDKARAAELAGKMRAKVLFEISSNDRPVFTKYWLVDLKSTEQPSVTLFSAKEQLGDIKPHVTLQLTDKNFISLCKGSLSPEFAYIRGSLKIQGSMGVALKIKPLLEIVSSLKI